MECNKSLDSLRTRRLFHLLKFGAFKSEQDSWNEGLQSQLQEWPCVGVSIAFLLLVSIALDLNKSTGLCSLVELHFSLSLCIAWKVVRFLKKIWPNYQVVQDFLTRGSIGAISPLKPAKVTFFTMILNNSENNIRDLRPFYRRLFCHSRVMKYTLSRS